MTLFELLGLTAVAAGMGASYGFTRDHDIAFWIGQLVGLALGIMVFVAWHRRAATWSTSATPDVDWRSLPLMSGYFASVFVASFGGAVLASRVLVS